MEIGIIGGGPAGIIAALEARKGGASVTLFDKNEFLGRKLSVTGGGRCNLTNMNVSPNSYHSINQFAFGEIIHECNYIFLNQYFTDLGIFTYHTDDGWVYPVANSARNISDYLEDLLIDSNVKLKKNTSITEIFKNGDKFILITNQEENFKFDKIILATGGKAYPQLNASDQILTQVTKFGHHFLSPHPALAPILTSKLETKSLNGVRTDAFLQLKKGDNLLGSTTGNIIFTDWGINGPGVMDLSHLVDPSIKDLKIEIQFSNLFPENFIYYVEKNNSNYPHLMSPFLPALNKKIIDQLFRNLKLDGQNKFSIKEFLLIWSKLRFIEQVTGTRGFEFSQISTGAVISTEINPLTLESRLCPGLFFAGELLDVLGPCGGYNLHWAFVSGYVAGKSVLTYA